MTDLQYTGRRKITYSSISVRVPSGIKQRFRELLEQEGTTPNEFFKKAITDRLNETEDAPLEAFKIDYVPGKDTFRWSGLRAHGAESVQEPLAETSAETVEMVLEAMQMGLKTRKTYLEEHGSSSKANSMSSMRKGIKKLNKG